MSQAIAEKQIAENEYLALEEKSNVRHEFMDGEIFLMAGATRRHNLLTNNISTELNLKLRESACEVYASDFRVKVRENHNVYPDVAIACAHILTQNNETTLLNPVVVFEVLSKSTEARDRGVKAEDYFRLDSLQEYILVSQYRLRVEHYSRQKNNEWKLQIYEYSDDVIRLESINCEIELKLIYLKVDLPKLKLINRR